MSSLELSSLRILSCQRLHDVHGRSSFLLDGLSSPGRIGLHVKPHHPARRHCPAKETISSNFPGRCTGTIPTGFRRCAATRRSWSATSRTPSTTERGPDVLAYRGGEVCGRIAAILNQGHIAHYNDRRGFFGFFDCGDDQEAANGLFDAVRQLVRRPGHPPPSRADQSVAELRVGPADRRLRFAADVHDDLQPALLRAADRELRLPQDARPVRLLGPHRHAAEDRRRSSGRSPSRSSSATTSSSARWTRRVSSKTWRCSCRSTTARW